MKINTKIEINEQEFINLVKEYLYRETGNEFDKNAKITFEIKENPLTLKINVVENIPYIE